MPHADVCGLPDGVAHGADGRRDAVPAVPDVHAGPHEHDLRGVRDGLSALVRQLHQAEPRVHQAVLRGL